MKEALTEVGDFKIGGRIINKVRFADDTAVWLSVCHRRYNVPGSNDSQ